MIVCARLGGSSPPLVSQPQTWTLVFKRKAKSRFRSFIAFGRYKHVCAYGYVPFLHVWVFFDPHWEGNRISIAADGPAAEKMIEAWIVDADLVLIEQRPFKPVWCPPIFGWCAPTISRLIGLPGSALRATTLFRTCLEHGGRLFEIEHGRSGGRH